MKLLVTILLFTSSLLFVNETAFGQITPPPLLQYRLAEGVVQISKPGEKSVLINLWGDVNAPGRFRVPEGTTLIELISFARGPASFRTGETSLDWSKLRIEVNLSRWNQELSSDEVVNFRFRYTQQLPPGMRNFVLKENDFITLEVKRRPAFVDYMRIIGPLATVAATLILFVDKL